MTGVQTCALPIWGTTTLTGTNARISLMAVSGTVTTITLASGSNLIFGPAGNATVTTLNADAASVIDLDGTALAVTSFSTNYPRVNASGGSLSIGSTGYVEINGGFDVLSLPAAGRLRLGGPVSFSGNVTLGIDTAGNFNANNRRITFNGATSLSQAVAYTFEDIYIAPGGSLTLAGAATQITIGGDWENRGTFTHGNKRMELVAGTGPSSILGSSTFYDLYCIALDKVIIFEAEIGRAHV